MAKIKQTVKIKKRAKVSGSGASMEKCHICHGVGFVPKQKKKK